MTGARQPDVPEALDAIGDRLREERERAGLSQRKLAKSLGLSPSLISQLEGGQTKPSVGTLYSIVTELDVSLDSIMRGEEIPALPRVIEEAAAASPVVHPGSRQSIELASGVLWDDLNSETEDEIDFLHAVYEVGGTSTPDESLMRHHGREYGYVMSGTLGIQIGFNDYTLEEGDSIAFDSERPHRLYNKGDVPVHAIWFVVGRDTEPRSR